MKRHKHSHETLANSTALYIVVLLGFVFSGIAFILSIIAIAEKRPDNATSDTEPQLVPLGVALESSVRLSENLYISNDTIYHRGMWLSRYIHLYTAADVIQKRAKFVVPPGVNRMDTCQPGFTPGTRWKVTENWMVLTTNQVGLSSLFISSVIQRVINGWNSAATFGVFGSKIPWTGDGPDVNAPDGRNEFDFGPIDMDGVLAFTVSWGRFDNFPLAQREIFEWDIRVNDRDYNWGDATQESDAYDFEGVAAHEFGHGTGLEDVYIDNCEGVLMFGSRRRGQVVPRAPTPEDIKSECELYNCQPAKKNGARASSAKDFWVIFSITGLVMIVLL